jgi:tRNA(Ile)-lysidine synthase
LVRYLQKLRERKNLLAFSAGVDSTALFFLLVENGIEFDIAIVDYQKRESSKDEVAYAKELAQKYKKECFIKEVILEDSNFEHQARFERYGFFEEIINLHGYKNLLTAHQLNDRVEWFLMQFTKGAGSVELLGFEAYEKRENYNLIRPLIETTKEELLNYLHKLNIKYFEDESNFEDRYKRNRFRKEYANKLLREYKSGIKKSFEYLNLDKERLFKLDILTHKKDLYILKKSEDDIENLRAIDKIIKRLGIIISAKEREEILRQGDIVIAHKIAVVLSADKIFIAPFVEAIMDKEFKEKCRVLKIPPKIRGYLWSEGIDIKTIGL